MSNGDDNAQVNCILGVCCDSEAEGDAKKVKALVEVLTKNLGPGKHSLHDVAVSMLHSFDFAEKGTLQPFKDSIAKLARGNPYV